MAKALKPIRTDPALWEACKKETVEKMGKFSARAMQQAVVLYKKRGGGYLGQKSTHNALVKWGVAQKKENRPRGTIPRER